MLQNQRIRYAARVSARVTDSHHGVVSAKEVMPLSRLVSLLLPGLLKSYGLIF